MGINKLSNHDVLRSMARPCWRKEQHNSRGKAEAAMRSLLHRDLAKDDKLINAYECRYCGKWHTGHRKVGAS